jgi:enamine deaminase RidA (YjgF/YER057c/UK114 family)
LQIVQEAPAVISTTASAEVPDVGVHWTRGQPSIKLSGGGLVAARSWAADIIGDGNGPCSEAGMTNGAGLVPARQYIKREAAQTRAYSQAVITEGGRIVWLAGQVGAADATGKSLAGDFDGQVREIFSRLRQTLEEAGGTLADMVTMTVFITDARYGDRFTQLRNCRGSGDRCNRLSRLIV